MTGGSVFLYIFLLDGKNKRKRENAMCTAIKHGLYVGRNLDVYKTYGEDIIITPRNYAISLRKEANIQNHYAMIGMGTVARGYPLYYDAANEHGLYMAGLNFVGNAHYTTPSDGLCNLAPYELIPYILAKCKTVAEAKAELANINLVSVPFSRELPLAELHWMIADKSDVITVEPDKNGISIYDNPIGVLTNNPHFPLQLFALNSFRHLSTEAHGNTFLPEIDLAAYSEGMGAIGMPGDLSSASRFIRAAFHTAHARTDSQIALFQLLKSVAMPDGSVKVGDLFERTEFTTGVSLCTMTYYYQGYDSAAISAVRLFCEDVDAPSLIIFPTKPSEPLYQN